MQLTTYITDLLYRYECVIIPGFGAFLTRYKSAFIEAETDTFHPPSKVISFNRQLQTNDGLLANYIASVDKCSYEIALSKIRKYTARFASDLSKGETVSFENIGQFFLNEEKSLQFEPVYKHNFNTSAFGLSSFVAPKLIREIQTQEVEEKSPKVRSLPQQRDSRSYLKYAAVAVIALSAVGFGSMKVYESQVQKYNYAERQHANILVENQIQEATFVIENPLPALSLKLLKQTGNYHIVAGAYQLEENAEKRIDQLREKGFSPYKMETSRYGLHQVLYASFEDRASALKNLYEIRRTDNPDAWLLVQQLD